MENVNATEAARLLGITVQTLKKWLDKGKIQGEIIYVDGLRQWAIPLAEIERIQALDRTRTGTSIEQRVSELERRVEALERLPTRPTQTKPLTPLSGDVPRTEGTLALADFANVLGISRRSLLDYVMRHNLTHIAVEKRAGEMRRSFTSEQQEAVRRFLDERGIGHR